jgi:hypothetical protein
LGTYLEVVGDLCVGFVGEGGVDGGLGGDEELAGELGGLAFLGGS